MNVITVFLLILVLSQVEYLVVAVDEQAKKARLSLAQADILKSLARDEALWKVDSGGKNEEWVDRNYY